ARAAPGKFAILDVRLAGNVKKGRIPGAAAIDIRELAAAFDKGAKPDAVAKRLADAGLDASKTGIVYGMAKTSDPARAGWMLRFWGVKDVRLLDGGIEAWGKAGGKLETAAPRSVEAAELKPRVHLLATKDDMLKGLDEKGFPQIIDARTAGEHCGEMKLSNK